jgi:hypothetical protein
MTGDGAGANRLGLTGAAIDLVFALGLAVLLLLATEPVGDAVPRPLVLLALFATPGVIALIGSLANRRSLLVGAALPLIPGAILSWSGVTLVFRVPAFVMLLGAITGAGSRDVRLFEVVLPVAISVLVLAAAIASLFVLTADECRSLPRGAGEACSSSAITVEGVAAGGALLLAALAVAALAAAQRIAAAR